MYWNYRIVRCKEKGYPKGYCYRLCEVFYRENGKPFAFAVIGGIHESSKDAIKKTIEWYALAAKKPILEQAIFYKKGSKLPDTLFEEQPEQEQPE